MIAAFAAALALQPAQTAPAVGRFDMGERLKLMESAWLATKDKDRKSKAVAAVSQAVTSFFTQQWGAACRSLDQATAILEGRTAGLEDAVTLRFVPGHTEPGKPANLVVSWAYRPTSTGSVTIEAAGVKTTIPVGETRTISVAPEDLDVSQDSEAPALSIVDIKVGELDRSAFVSVVRNYTARAAALQEAKNPIAKEIGDLLQVQASGQSETDIPLIDYLFFAERMEKGQLPLSKVQLLPIARQGRTLFRASLPAEIGPMPTVVIALHGAGGSENLFFEGYGRGLAVQLAQRRGWIFMSPRASQTAVQDCLDWLKQVRGIEPGKVAVMGHSMGGGLTLLSGAANPAPSAIALFAPAGGRLPDNLAKTPTFLAVGKQEMMMLKTTADRLGDQLKGRSDAEFKVYDPCEHLMIVADALPDAYAFLDRVLKQP